MTASAPTPADGGGSGGGSAPGTDQLAGILDRLDDLTDLFRRRLLDDREKRAMIQELGRRAEAAERGLFRQYLHPLVSGLALVVDRLDRYDGPDRAFADSVAGELLDLLATYGVTEVPTQGDFDPAYQEAVSAVPADPEHPPGSVVAVYSRGFAHGSWVFRPARVAVARRQ